jgi:hypothetical protein
MPRPPAPTPDAVRPTGQVRRSQVISTYSIGAIVDLPAVSCMPMGLEEWDYQIRGGRAPELTIYESRLQAQLGVDYFRLPPIVAEISGQPGMVDRRYAVPCVRFPEWHECPKCQRLGIEGAPFLVAADGNTLVCEPCHTSNPVNPVRFVRACDKGHIEDFPWIWWAHRNRNEGTCENPRLFLRSRGESASLADLYVYCNSCKASKSLGDALLGESLRELNCRGARPWLHDFERGCDRKPRALQRGASNIHFPVTASALSIPPVSEPLFQLLDDHWDVIRTLPEAAVAGVLQGFAKQYNAPAGELMEAYSQRVLLERGEAAQTDFASRSQEYLALGANREEEVLVGKVPQFCSRVAEAPEELTLWFDLIGAVSRLREVRVMVGFSRIEPLPVTGERILKAVRDGDISPLSKTPYNWLPAAEIRGEGIFLRFRSSSVEQWIRDNPKLAERAAALERRSAAVAAERGYEREYTITPRLLLVHSFAHAMIRQLSIDCGYSSSALRERLFIADPEGGSDPMNGVLIYTGSPDSEGSLGGLVRLAAPELIRDAVIRAVRHARWCGSDPVCRETDPVQSGDRISGAACHCCLLVPETACEKFNRELDRTVLVGDAEGNYKGFFERLCEDD